MVLVASRRSSCGSPIPAVRFVDEVFERTLDKDTAHTDLFF